MFEKHPNAKTVGERTSGHVHYGNLGRLWLRGSNVIVGIPTQRRVFEDGRSVEKVGYAPQIPVAPGGDALEAALSDIQQFL
jgi:C-terminal processing protease CtpA/Prc